APSRQPSDLISGGCQSKKLKLQESDMSAGNIPKINVRNSVNECAQSLKKENAGKYHNYGIKDCIISIAATKQK
ncbi:hypothetical protein, partial [Polynucleobacter sp. 39-46-10]|uniref:hypothetical protein n=1 Tax=Polynucleobacter sp. 39-46-10 TaxID=1970428 RepID=UPI000BD9BC6D